MKRKEAGPRKKPKGVGFRQDGSLYCNVRYRNCKDSVKLFTSKIETEEVGALCYDICHLLSEKQMESVPGGKRKAASKLNFPEYSRTLHLEDFPSGLDIWKDTEEGMNFILVQAKRAAANLPESLRRSTPAVGDAPCVSEVEQDLSNKEVLESALGIRDASHECSVSILSKSLELGDLENMRAGIVEGSGVISIPIPGPEEFHHHMAYLKLCLDRDGKSPLILEKLEQKYKSMESKCLEMRRILEDHNSKAIAASLMSPENRTAGRQRSSGNERLPRVPEMYPPDEHDDVGVPVGVSETCGPPGSLPASVTPGGTDTTMAIVEMDLSQPVVDPIEMSEEDIEEWFKELLSHRAACPHARD